MREMGRKTLEDGTMADKNIEEITKQLEQGVKDVFTSDKYVEYLKFMSRFYNYSVNNIILIMMQKPEASLVAGYKAWQTKFKRQVRKGEKGITILAPCQHKKKIEDEDGETKEVVWTSYKAVKVFDVSQTDGEELPTGCTNELVGDVQNYNELIEKLTSISPVPIACEDVEGSANGYFHTVKKQIVIQKDMSQQQTVKTLIHEIAHSILHDREMGEAKDADNNTREVQAESVAYTVCSMLGLDTSDYSFGYVAGWSTDKEVKELNASMEVIRKTAKTILDGIVKEMA